MFSRVYLIKIESKKSWKKCEKVHSSRVSQNFLEVPLSTNPTWEKIHNTSSPCTCWNHPRFLVFGPPLCTIFCCKLGLFDQPSSKTFQPQLLKSQISFNQFLLASKRNPSEKNPQPSTDFYFKPIFNFKALPKNYGKKLPSRHQPLNPLRSQLSGWKLILHGINGGFFIEPFSTWKCLLPPALLCV